MDHLCKTIYWALEKGSRKGRKVGRRSTVTKGTKCTRSQLHDEADDRKSKIKKSAVYTDFLDLHKAFESVTKRNMEKSKP